MEVKNGLITFYGFYPSLYLCSPLKKERPKHATRGAIVLPTAVTAQPIKVLRSGSRTGLPPS